MMIDSMVFTASKGEEVISQFAKDCNMNERDYLSNVASKSYVLVKESKTGLKVATWENGMPEVFNSYALANEELEDKTNTDIAYKGYKIMKEIAYWDEIGATEIFSLAIVC